VHMGEVRYDKVEHNDGVLMGNAYATATDGNRITGQILSTLA
jgi:hypothetical protein